jgi:hypothetical protein
VCLTEDKRERKRLNFNPPIQPANQPTNQLSLVEAQWVKQRRYKGS